MNWAATDGEHQKNQLKRDDVGASVWKLGNRQNKLYAQLYEGKYWNRCREVSSYSFMSENTRSHKLVDMGATSKWIQKPKSQLKCAQLAADYLSESLHQMISWGVATVSVFSNTLLIPLILHRSSCGLCGYRWLLLTFAFGNIIISLYNALVQPKYIQTENGYVILTLAALNKPPHIGFAINTVYFILFHQPFILLMIHFVYRYLRLIKPNVLGKNRWGFPTLAVAANVILITNVFYSNVLLQQHLEEDNFESEPLLNVIMINFVKSPSHGGGVDWTTIRAIAHSGFVILLSLVGIVSCTIRIILDTKLSRLSLRTHKLQLQLIHSLILQCLVAFWCLFIPYFVMVISPFIGISFSGSTYSLITSSYPTIDANLTILTMKRFRVLTYSWVSPLSPRKQMRKVSATVGNMFISFRDKTTV